MDWPTATKWFIAANAFCTAGWAALAMLCHGRDASISVVLGEFCDKYPPAGIVLALVFAHIFLPRG